MGSEQHYSLRWNDYTVKIVTAFQSLRDEEDFVDVTVACDGHSYSAHKMVLSACSPYFRALLRANPCQHPIVILKDVGHLELERLLEFMYNGEVSIAQDQLAAFLRTAENLKIRGLAGSSDDMDQMGQLHRPDVSYSYSSCSVGGGGGTSGRSSPSAGYAPSQGSKDEDGGGDGSIGYHNRTESPPTKRRKRSSAPAAGHADSNTVTHPSEVVVGDTSVEVEGGGSVSGVMPGEDNVRLDRRDPKSEPGDPLADVYSESSELTDPASHTGEGLDPRQPVLYPLALPGPSGSAGNQDTIGSHESGEVKMGVFWDPHPSHCTCDSCRCCGFCGKMFSTVGSRKRHERDKHVEPGSLPCELCGKWCKNRGALIKHKSILHRTLLSSSANIDFRYESSLHLHHSQPPAHLLLATHSIGQSTTSYSPYSSQTHAATLSTSAAMSTEVPPTSSTTSSISSTTPLPSILSTAGTTVTASEVSISEENNTFASLPPIDSQGPLDAQGPIDAHGPLGPQESIESLESDTQRAYHQFM